MTTEEQSFFEESAFERSDFEHSETPPLSGVPSALKALIEAIIYVAEDPVTVDQMAAVIEDFDRAEIQKALAELLADTQAGARGIEIREIAGGYKMFTKPEHHELVRRFVKSLTPPLRLSMAALETLATIAYRQPVTLPEIQAIRGVQGAGVVKTLLDRKLINTAGRKDVIGRPILYRTTREFLVQFGLGSLQDLPSMEEFEELLKSSFGEGKTTLPAATSAPVDGSASPENSESFDQSETETPSQPDGA